MILSTRHSARLTAFGAAWLAVFAIDILAAHQMVAPDVEMRDRQGRRVRPSDFRGKVVLLDLWASWCPPCKSSFPALDALYREYRSRGVQVIAVNLDQKRKDAEIFLNEHPHEMLVVFDPRARVLEAFSSSTLRAPERGDGHSA